MPTTPQSTAQETIIASLSRQAVRQGQSIWFRVASNSMNPTLQVGDHVRIEPAKANEIRLGEIAAFEASDGLIIHRIVQRQQTNATVRLLQMADVQLHPSWIEEQAVVGRVVATRRQDMQIDLQHPIAQWCGTVTAYLRYQLYRWKKYRLSRRLLYKCSRLAVYMSYWCICGSRASSVVQDKSLEVG